MRRSGEHGEGKDTMSETQSAISFKLPAELKQEVGEVIKKHDLTLTGLVLDYFRRRVRAEREAEGREGTPGGKLVELTVLLEEGLNAAVWNEAGRLGVPIGEYVHRLCEGAARDEAGRPAPPAVTPPDYPDFPRLVDCVRQAYLEDRSPVDALLRLYPSLAPSQVPMGQLFAAAIAAVPVDQIISERVELGLRLWREKGRGGPGTGPGGPSHKGSRSS